MKELPDIIISFLSNWNHDLSNIIMENLNLASSDDDYVDSLDEKFDNLVLEYLYELDKIHNELNYSEQIEFYNMLPLTLKNAYTALLDNTQLLACKIIQ